MFAGIVRARHRRSLPFTPSVLDATILRRFALARAMRERRHGLSCSCSLCSLRYPARARSRPTRRRQRPSSSASRCVCPSDASATPWCRRGSRAGWMAPPTRRSGSACTSERPSGAPEAGRPACYRPPRGRRARGAARASAADVDGRRRPRLRGGRGGRPRLLAGRHTGRADSRRDAATRRDAHPWRRPWTFPPTSEICWRSSPALRPREACEA